MTTERTLEEVFSVITDGTHASPGRSDSGYPVLSAQNVTRGVLNEATSRFTTKAELDDFQRRIEPKRGDVLLTIVGTIGRSAVVEAQSNFVLQRSVAILRPDPTFLDSRYAHHYFGTTGFQKKLHRASNTSAQAGIYLGKLRNLSMPVPPLPEQRRIAAILDTANAARHHRAGRALELASLETSLADSILSTSGHPEVADVPLATVMDALTGPFGTAIHKEDYVTGGIPIVNPTHIRDGRIVPDRRLTVSQAKADELETYALRPNDVVLARRGEMGRAAVVLERSGRMLCGTGSMILRPKNGKVTGSVLAQLVTSRSAKRELTSRALGVTMLNLNQKIVSNLPVEVPPMENQLKYEDALHRIDRLRDLQARTEELDSELWRALSSCFFQRS